MTTYYVDGVDGNDANAGTSEGSGNAWATIDKAMNTVAAGDKVYVKGNGTYAEQATIDTAGTTASPIVFEGYTTTTGDNGKATMDGATYCINATVTSTTAYIFKNFNFTGCTQYGVYLNNQTGVTFINCASYSNGSGGFYLDRNMNLVNCESYSNGSWGVVTADSTCRLFGCKIYSNAQVQCEALTKGFTMYKCLVYGAASSSQHCVAGDQPFIILGCTLDGENTAKGVESANNASTYIDNIIYDCSTGIDNSVSPLPYTHLEANNLFNSNVTDMTNTNGVTDELYRQSGAPAFTDEAGDDYTLGASSPAIDNGMAPGCIT